MVASRQHIPLLVADDDEGFRETLLEMLPPQFDPICVERGDAAIEVVENREIQLALFDVHMPVMTGVEVLRAVKRLRAELPCILMSADWTQELRLEALEADAFTLLSKPVSRVELVSTVTLAMDASQ